MVPQKPVYFQNFIKIRKVNIYENSNGKQGPLSFLWTYQGQYALYVIIYINLKITCNITKTLVLKNVLFKNFKYFPKYSFLDCYKRKQI